MDSHGWHLDKKLSISHIMTTLILAASIFSWGANMDKRLSLVERDVVRQEQEVKRVSGHINSKLEAIDKKIDRLIERELKRVAR